MDAVTKENPVQCETSHAHVRVTVNGEVVADTQHALLVHELGHAPVWYIPPSDIVTEHFIRTDHTTHCPRKGDATYWTVLVGGEKLENAAWSYETPFPQTAALKGYLSFYTDLVAVQAEGSEHTC